MHYLPYIKKHPVVHCLAGEFPTSMEVYSWENDWTMFDLSATRRIRQAIDCSNEKKQSEHPENCQGALRRGGEKMRLLLSPVQEKNKEGSSITQT